jgi:phosphatidylserine/phosphatidylglycerophosphate/cardiolipin synthase-like enzyme
MLLVLLLAVAFQATPAPAVYFSPHGGCTDAVVAELGKAKRCVRVQAFSFTSKPIAEALNAASARKVDVSTILDGGQVRARSSLGPAMKSPVHYDFLHAIAHNKVMIIDDEVVITGSFNFTDAAENHNAENLLVIRSRALAGKYRANWELHLKHSQDSKTAREP